MNNLEQLVNYDDKPVPTFLEQRQEKIRPYQWNNYKQVFKIDSVGYLDPESMITVQLKTNQTMNGNYRVNQMTGILGGIKRARLYASDILLEDNQAPDKLSVLKYINTLPADVRNGYWGHLLGIQNAVQIMSSADANRPNSGGGTIQANIGQTSGISIGDNQNPRSDPTVHNCPILATTAGTFKYGIPLYLLFNSLKGRQIPLHLFRDYQLRIEIDWKTSDKYVNNDYMDDTSRNNNNLRSLSGDVIPDTQNSELFINYILPPASIMEAELDKMNQQGGYPMLFNEVVDIKKVLPATASAANREEQVVEHYIGLENKEVNTITLFKNVQNSVNSDNTRYWLDTGSRAMLNERYNVKFNGQWIYNEEIDNVAQQYNLLTDMLGNDVDISRPMILWDENVITSVLTYIDSGLQGTYKPLCIADLRDANGNGQRCTGSKIVVEFKNDRVNSVAGYCKDYRSEILDCDYVCELSRRVNIVNSGNKFNIMVAS